MDNSAQDLPPDVSEDTVKVEAPRPRRLLRWLLGLVVVLGATAFLMSRGGSDSDAGAPIAADGQMPMPEPVTQQTFEPGAQPADPGAAAPTAALEAGTAAPNPNAPESALAAEMAAGGAPSADAAAPSLNPQVAQLAEDPAPPAPPPMEEPVNEPPPPPPPPKAKAKASAKGKSHRLAVTRNGLKVPKALKKAKVVAFVAKKLDGDKTCLPGDLSKKELKPFTAVVNVSKSGAITAVTTQPKMPHSKAIAGCIKKKLSGSPALFKSKSSNRISIPLRAK